MEDERRGQERGDYDHTRLTRQTTLFSRDVTAIYNNIMGEEGRSELLFNSHPTALFHTDAILVKNES